MIMQRNPYETDTRERKEPAPLIHGLLRLGLCGLSLRKANSMFPISKPK